MCLNRNKEKYPIKKGKIFFIESSSNFGHLRWWQDRWIVLSSKKERRKEKDGKINRTKFSSASVLLFCGKKRRTLQKVPLLVPLFYFHSAKKCPITLNPLLHSSACTQFFSYFYFLLCRFEESLPVLLYFHDFHQRPMGWRTNFGCLCQRVSSSSSWGICTYRVLHTKPKSLKIPTKWRSKEKIFLPFCRIFFLISNQTHNYCAWVSLILLHKLR